MELTLEDVRKQYGSMVIRSNLYTRLRLACWLNHSESRVRNGNAPFSFDVYDNSMQKADYINQVQYDVIDCTELGGKETVLECLAVWA